jgi:hypothetical protein
VADLEAPDPPTPPAAETPPAAPDTPPTTEPADPEGTTDVGGQKMVPLSALAEARAEKRALKGKADQYDQLAGYVHQIKPYVDFLAANPTLMTRTQQETAPTTTTTTQPVDEGALELARTLDLYTAAGEPDVLRAQKVQKIIKVAAKAEATAEVEPLRESTVRERSGFMYQRALVTKAPDGRTVDRATLDAIWSRTDPKISSTEEGAAGLVAMALGLQILQGGGAPAPSAAAPAAPLHTEPAGGRNTNRLPISALEQSIAKLRGLDDKTYGERSKGYVPGRASVLED